MTGPDRLEYLYKEYVRLASATDSFVRSSFDDFKMLGAIGVLLAWPPLAEIRSELGSPDGRVFRQGADWVRWEAQWYRPLLGHSAAVFTLILLGFPLFVLAVKGEAWEVAAYAGTFLLIAALVANGEARLRKAAQAEPQPAKEV